jgi:NTP pyrophosphatase (non-canonical NTP hydrolase)
MDAQHRVAAFVDEHDLDCPPAYRLLDLTAEVGELAADANATAGYGETPDSLTVDADEIGAALFALLAFAESTGVDAGSALESSISKYEERLEETGSAGSG